MRVTVAVAGIVLSSTFSLAFFKVDVSAERVEAALIALPEALISAFSEEVVFRVMLLSYLASLFGRPISALIVTSLVFGLGHVPFDSLREWSDTGNWVSTSLAVYTVLKVAIGMFLGVLWLTTRSLASIGFAHTLINWLPEFDLA